MKVNKKTILYASAGVAVLLGMGAIKLVTFLLHKAVVAMLHIPY